MLRLGARTALAPPPDVVAPGPALGLKMVLRLLEDVGGSACLGAAGGGGTEKRARSWASVSRIRLVMSWFCSSALVNILGGAKLDAVQKGMHGGSGTVGILQLGNGRGAERDLLEMRIEQRHDGHLGGVGVSGVVFGINNTGEGET